MTSIDFEEIIKFEKRYDRAVSIPLLDLEEICLNLKVSNISSRSINIGHSQVLEDVLQFYEEYNPYWYKIIVREIDNRNIVINELFLENSGWFCDIGYRVEIAKRDELSDILVYAHEFAHALEYILNMKFISKYDNEIFPLKMEEEITKYYKQKYPKLRDIFNLRINEIKSIYVDNVLCEIDLYKKFDSGYLSVNQIDQIDYENIKILNGLELLEVYIKYIYAVYKLEVDKVKIKKK